MVIGLLAGFALFLGLVILIGIRQERKRERILERIAQQLNAVKSGRGMSAAYGTAQYQYKYGPGSRYEPAHLDVVIDGRSGGSFQVAKESSFDKISKAAGISTEIQTGDPQFDDNFYLTSDQACFASALFVSAEKREAVQEIFRLGFTEIKHDGKRIEAKWFPFKLEETFDPALITRAVSQMEILAKDMPREPLPVEYSNFPRWMLAETLALIVPLALFAAAFFLQLFGTRLFQPLDAGKLLLDSLKYSLASLIAFMGFLILLLKGRSSAHRTLWGSLFLSFLAFPIAGIAVETFFNGWLDGSAALPHTAQVAGEYTRSSRGGNDYYLWVSSWRTPGDFEKIKVFRDFYGKVVPHKTMVTVLAKPGRFGFEWVESIAISSSPLTSGLEEELKTARLLKARGGAKEAAQKTLRVVQEAEDEKQIRDAAALLSELGVIFPSAEERLSALRPPDAAIKIGLVPIGPINRWLLAEVIIELELKLGMRFFVVEGSLPVGKIDRSVGAEEQADANRLIDEIKAQYPLEAGSDIKGYLGITQEDLFAQDMNFLFANAQRGYGVMSYHRFLAGANIEPPYRPRLRRRFLKQAISSAFFVLGIARCTSPMCVRAYPNSLSEHDRKGTELCDWCRKQLSLLIYQTPK